MKQYLDMFIEETKEHLQNLNQSLLELEKNPEDKSVINEIFRVAHTLKGMSGTMGFSRMSRLTHDMENVLDAIRNDCARVNSLLVDTLFKCLDALDKYLSTIIDTGSEGETENSDIITALSGILIESKDNPAYVQIKPAENPGNLDDKPATAAADVIGLDEYEQNVVNKAKDSGLNAYQITITLDNGCVLKSARAFIIFRTLERYSEIIKSVPGVQDIEDERFDLSFTVVVVSRETGELFSKELNSISEVNGVTIAVLDRQPGDIVPASIPGNETSVSFGVSTGYNTAAHDKADEHAAQNTPRVKSKTGKTVRVDIDRLDVLMNLVGELIITKTRLEDIDGLSKSQEFNETVEYLDRITSNLNDAVMKVRMVPVETVFNRFPRMVRDISRNLGKEIDLIMTGVETELDRTVIDEIGDPLIHLLRNSVDHGIESPEKRKEIGKAETGYIYLRAYQSGNNVLIEVEDDGQGIDIERVREKAVEKGLIDEDSSRTLPDKDVVDMLFRPNFSTVEKVTDLSGRGVGLDVVKTKIGILGGTVDVETEQGKGSKFIIKLPLTLAIIQALLVRIGNEKYAIPLSSINQIVNVIPEDIKMVQKKEVILLRNILVPIVRLSNVLDIPMEDEEQKQLTVVIVRKSERLSGFVVDSIIGQQEIVIKSLGKLLSGIKLVAGATILGDGNVALILDVNSLA